MNSEEFLNWITVSPQALNSNELSECAARPECGAIVTFCGTARVSSSTGNEIRELEYDTDIGLAEARMHEVVAVARSRWPQIVAVAIHHRIGTVALKEPAVVVTVSSPHRLEAFEAAQFCIDAVKSTVPMWKREVWQGGSTWSLEAQDIKSVHEL